ncbi:hypothetical protein GCM10011410_22140 [Hoyosella rhizosphaerae]|uniref:Uncharacterized protein n=1 Tax=Hoyosella rhizosphaerae TaxID=1755582 RepID=A0A916UE02_9ACTN|nr:hypothetical protein GCM10011410_22140 [Hoyosella rhizosphaerae]
MGDFAVAGLTYVGAIRPRGPGAGPPATIAATRFASTDRTSQAGDDYAYIYDGTFEMHGRSTQIVNVG